MLEVQGVFKSYATPQGPLAVLQGVDLHLGQGSSLALMGESGSGKSTLLHLLAGLDKADSGVVKLAGDNLAMLTERELGSLRNRHVGFVYQFHHLLSEFDARENVAMPMLIAGEDRQLALEKAAELLARVNLDTRLDHRPSALSGGERQRVAIARALAADPAVVLADEPTGNLDEDNANQIHDLMLSLSEETGTALVVVTHNQEFAERMQVTRRLHGGVLERT